MYSYETISDAKAADDMDMSVNDTQKMNSARRRKIMEEATETWPAQRFTMAIDDLRR